VFPAEYDIFIDFAPIKYNTNSDEEPTSNGYLQFKAYHTMTNPAVAGDTTWTNVERIESLVTSGDTEVTTVSADPTDNSDAYAPTDDNDLPEQKISMEDGTVVT